jgi:hypothetical protein
MLFDPDAFSPSTSYRPVQRSVSVSTASSEWSDATAATTMSFDSSENKPTVINEKFRQTFSQIIRRWSRNELTKEDVKYLESTHITDKDYLVVTEDFSLRHGVELVNHRIHLIEYPTALHEFINRKMDKWIDRSFGDDIVMLGSTSKKSLLIRANI